MTQAQFTVDDLSRLLPSLCAEDTAAARGNGWSSANPLKLHCAVGCLLAQKLFGGELRRISLAGTPYADSGSHYFNRLDDRDFDLTIGQFAQRDHDMLRELPSEPRTREHVIGGADTRERYAKLAFRFAAATHEGNALFADPIYRRCLEMAYASPCQKAGFGAVMLCDGAVVGADNNRTIGPLAGLCQPQCIRFGITSRTESMLGACGHAEEWAIQAARAAGAPLDRCELFIAGISPNGWPYVKSVAEHTCLRCSVAMHYAGLAAVHVPVVNRWESISTERCLETAKAFALGEKKV